MRGRAGAGASRRAGTGLHDSAVCRTSARYRRSAASRASASEPTDPCPGITTRAARAYGSSTSSALSYAGTSSGSNGNGSSTSLSMSPATSTRGPGSQTAVCPGGELRPDARRGTSPNDGCHRRWS